MSLNQPLSGVILAAGIGSRMGDIGRRYPKAMLPVCNRPLIKHHIENLKSVGIVDIVVVIGHGGHMIAESLGNGESLGVNIRYTEQCDRLGIAHAVGQARDLLSTPFLLFLGDIFFLPRDLQGMVDQYFKQGSGAVLAVKDEADHTAIRKNFSVTLNENNLVTRVIEKPRSVSNRLKGVGLYLFSPDIFDAIARTPRTALRNEYEITESIQIMIDSGQPVSVTYAIEDDINLTFPSDLLRCNLRVSRELKQDALCGSNLSLVNGAKLENCVVGSNVTIRHPISIRNTLILDNTCLEINNDIDNFILTPDVAIDCRGQ